MNKKLNVQEKFWKGFFGNNYISRNKNKSLINNNYFFFKKSLKKAKNIKTVLELGANIGNNILSLKKINNKFKFCAIEINSLACKELTKISNLEVVNDSILNFKIQKKFDLILLKGILIHIDHKNLKKLFSKINSINKKYILICEYYNPYPIKINYRGYKNVLFKNDYAGIFLKLFKNYKLLDYGFNYHLDKHPLDDSNWFLLKKMKTNK
jgi:pseudaminic acid biosynthesis-associated methylase